MIEVFHDVARPHTGRRRRPGLESSKEDLMHPALTYAVHDPNSRRIRRPEQGVVDGLSGWEGVPVSLGCGGWIYGPTLCRRFGALFT